MISELRGIYTCSPQDSLMFDISMCTSIVGNSLKTALAHWSLLFILISVSDIEVVHAERDCNTIKDWYEY